MPRIIIMSNHLPVTVEKGKSKPTYHPSVGGLATGMPPLQKEHECLWVGWPGIARKQLNAKEKEDLIKKLKRPVIIRYYYLKLILKDTIIAFVIRLSGLYSIVLPNLMFMKTSYGKPINKSIRFFVRLYLI